jgi:hypothetical protein
MQYLLLIYQSDAEFGKLSEAEKGRIWQGYGEFTQNIQKSGQLRSGAGLKPVDTATTVRVRGGKTLATDGPFAETKEQLSGFYLVEAKDVDEAIAIAARIPSARIGSIEVRPTITPPA